MSNKPQQLVLELPHRSALGQEDFLVSDSNRDAVDIVDSWPDWPHSAILLSGPEGAGKSHLAHVWKLSSNALFIEGGEITDDWVKDYDRGLPLIIENIDRVSCDEQALFHLLNLARERSFHILFTARSLPGAWSIDLPDLRSRLRAMPVVNIQPPDEILLQTLLVKLFDDRQLPISPSAIKYLARHMDRSTEMAVALVDAVDRAAWESTGQRMKQISRDLVSTVLEEMKKLRSAGRNTR